MTLSSCARFTVTAVVLAAAAILPAGCNDSDHAGGPGADHGHQSVHGGVAVELGDHQFQLDFLHDPAAGSLKAWVMDAHLENFVRIRAPSFDVVIDAAGRTNTVTLKGIANATTGESLGDTSQFEGAMEGLKGVTNFTATIPSVDIRGATFRDVRFLYPSATR